MKVNPWAFSALVLVGLQSCIWDSAKKAVDDAKASINQQIADAKRSADGLIEDPALRDSALNKLRDLIPDSLAIASNLNAGSESYSAKLATLQNALNIAKGTGTSSADLAMCLAAMPKIKTQINNPNCYGPSLNFDPSKHPDQNGINVQQQNQLPAFDLGLWTATENGQACAAAKMNQLTSNASYYADLAVGSMAMMVCAAAFQGDTIPGDGKVLNLSSRLNQIQGAQVKIDTALISHEGDTYHIVLKGVLNNDSVRIESKHNPSSGAGVIAVLSKLGQSNNGGLDFPYRATSVKYNQKSKQISYRLASAQYGNPAGAQNANTAVQNWKNSIQASTLELNIDPSTWSNDLNLIQASFDGQNSKVAYGWQAGAGDGMLRVFNAQTQGNTGTAWFGFSPTCTNGNSMPGSQSCSTNPISVTQLDQLLKIDRMICNWAGPGNNHTGQKLVQKQTMQLSGTQWTPIESKIRYAPTNSCTVTDAQVFPTLGAVNPHELLSLDASNYDFSVPLLP